MRKKLHWGGYQVKAFDTAPPSVRDRVIKAVFEAFMCKTEISKQAETAFAMHMKSLQNILRDCTGAEDLAVASLLPLNFTTALRLLQHTDQALYFLTEGGLALCVRLAQGWALQYVTHEC